MGKGSSRVDTDALFAGLIGTEKSEEPQAPKETVQSAENVKPDVKIGRKPDEEKKVQVSIYLTPSLARELRIQCAEKEKESDKSAIARTGIEIALALSSEDYAALKAAAFQRSTTPGQIVKEALAKYL